MFFRTLFKRYSQLQSASPYTTNFFTGGFLGASGDVICQTFLSDSPDSPYDLQRLLAMSTFGAFYSGAFSTLVYRSYSRLPAVLIDSKMKMGISCSLIDNFVHVPVLYTPAFYLVTGLMQGLTVEESTDTLRGGECGC